MIFDTDWSQQYQGPAVKAGAKVAVVVADANGQSSGGTDIGVYDDRGSAYGGLTYIQDHQSGNIQIKDGYSVAWTMDYNVVTQNQVFTLDSGKFTGDVYLQNEYSGADQYENNGNPNQVIGFNVLDNQGNGGAAANVISGATVTIKTKGSATFHNASEFASSPA